MIPFFSLIFFLHRFMFFAALLLLLLLLYTSITTSTTPTATTTLLYNYCYFTVLFTFYHLLCSIFFNLFDTLFYEERSRPHLFTFCVFSPVSNCRKLT